MSEKTIRIRLLTSIAGSAYTYAAGQETDAPEPRAAALIRAGYAVPVAGASGPKLPETAAAKPPKKETR